MQSAKGIIRVIQFFRKLFSLLAKEHKDACEMLILTNKAKNTTKAHLFHSSNHHKWLPYQILGGKTKKNVQIDSQTTDIWSK